MKQKLHMNIRTSFAGESIFNGNKNFIHQSNSGEVLCDMRQIKHVTTESMSNICVLHITHTAHAMYFIFFVVRNKI